MTDKVAEALRDEKLRRLAMECLGIVDRWREKETTGEVVGRIVAKLETAIAALLAEAEQGAHSSTDRAAASEAADAGSIPAGRATVTAEQHKIIAIGAQQLIVRYDGMKQEFAEAADLEKDAALLLLWLAHGYLDRSAVLSVAEQQRQRDVQQARREALHMTCRDCADGKPMVERTKGKYAGILMHEVIKGRGWNMCCAPELRKFVEQDKIRALEEPK